MLTGFCQNWKQPIEVNSNSHYNKQVEGVLERGCIQEKQQWNSLVDWIRWSVWRRQIRRRDHCHGRSLRWEVLWWSFLGGRYERRCWGFERWWCHWMVNLGGRDWWYYWCLSWSFDNVLAVDCDIGRNFCDDVFCCIGGGGGCHCEKTQELKKKEMIMWSKCLISI